MVGVLLLANFALVNHVPAQEGPVTTDHVIAELIAEAESIQPGRPFTVALRFEIDEHWHTYWRNPGDSGLETTIRWELPEGFRAGDIQWPHPKRLSMGPLINFGYEGTVLHLVEITPPDNLPAGGNVTLRARADWLVCEDVCLPGGADLALVLPVSDFEPRTDPRRTDDFVAARAALPASADGWRMAAAVDTEMLRISLVGPSCPETLTFYPYGLELIRNDSVQVLERSGGGVVLAVAVAANMQKPERLRGVLVRDEGWETAEGRPAIEIDVEWSASIAGGTDADAIPPGVGFFGAILLAFVGGLILNLMPCVFPVLGLKIMGFVGQAGEERCKVIGHGLLYTAGILVSFWFLAGLLLVLRAGGQELGWGFQLQSAGFVFGLMTLLFVFGLNMAGLFEIGASAIGVGSKLAGRPTAAGSFFSGVLATVVATPCAAPFLATALGAALALPAVQSITLFTFIALGLASPYLLMSAWPKAVHYLPRPGVWMESFKQGMSFLLFAAAGYLLWVLAAQVDGDKFLAVVFSLVVVALAGWVYGRWCGPERSATLRISCWILAGVFLLGGLRLGYPVRHEERPETGVQALEWIEWSPETIQRLRAEGRPIYIDFTARWCATCQTNKLAVFGSRDVIDLFRRHNIAAVRADWTGQDPTITRELARWNRSAIPFNLVILPGAEPVPLPELLVPSIVLEAFGGLPDS